MNVIDRAVSYGIQRLAHARAVWEKAMVKRRDILPAFLSDDVSMYLDTSFLEQEKTLSRRAMITLSWIYAAIELKVSEACSADLKVMRHTGKGSEEIKNHRLDALLDNPNDDMTGKFLWQYTEWWMEIRGKAFWFLMPDGKGEIGSIWPMRADRVFPQKSSVKGGAGKFIEYYEYKSPGRGGTGFKIPPQYVVFYRYPNPYDLWDGLAPMDAAMLPGSTDVAEARWQRDTFTTGRGVPQSVIALSETMGERDFLVAAAQIREDFQNERKIAITRSGELRVATVGLTPEQMRLIESREFTRDEIYIIFLGVAFHRIMTESGLAVADKFIKEKKIFPLHGLLAGQLSTQMVRLFYGEETFVEFEDIRPQDRSLNIQEFNAYGGMMTMDEARDKQGMMKIADLDRMPGYGKLPYKLAINPTFVTAYYGFGGGEGAEGEEGFTNSPSLPESDNAENVVNREAER